MFFRMADSTEEREARLGVSFALPASLKSKMESIAYRERRSASEIYRQAVVAYLEADDGIQDVKRRTEQILGDEDFQP